MSYRTPEELAAVFSKTGIVPLNKAHAVAMEKAYQATMVRLVCPCCGIWFETQRESIAKLGDTGMTCPSAVSNNGFGCKTFMEVRHVP